jgi:hypothetical protein
MAGFRDEIHEDNCGLYTLFDHKQSEDILKELQIETSHHTCPELPCQLEEPCKKNGESTATNIHT